MICKMKGKNMNYDITDYLKDDKELQKVVIQEFLNEIAEFKAENERLKEENRYYKAELKLSCNELDKSEKWNVFERRKKIKLKQTLQEIKAIAENCYDPADKENDGFYTILQKITKAEEE